MYAIQCPFKMGTDAVNLYAGTVRDWEYWGADGLCLFPETPAGLAEANDYLANYVGEPGARIVQVADGARPSHRPARLTRAEAYAMFRRPGLWPFAPRLTALRAWVAADNLAALSRTTWGWTTADAEFIGREMGGVPDYRVGELARTMRAALARIPVVG